MSYISENHDTIYFTRCDKQFKSSTLYSTQFVDGAWRDPEILPFSGKEYDAGISFSSNQNSAFFTSKRNPNRAELSEEWNIWKVRRSQNGWDVPKVLPYPINSDSLECCLTMNRNGEVYFSSNREGSWDIYEARFSDNKFHSVQKLNGPVNSANGEWPGYINDEGDKLLFSSIRKSGYGGDDLYMTRKIDNLWIEPLILDSLVNTHSYEDSPLITTDLQYLFFSSWRKTGFSDRVSNIYYINLDKISNNIVTQK